MRAVAVLLVVLFHAEIPGFGGGYVGVDVFFVISGFLISTHLLERLRDHGRIGFGSFYARRARRLLPAAFLVIAATVLLARWLVSPVQFDYVIKDAIAAAFYVPNFWFADQATDYLADKTPSLFLHFWSLGVEEQFYLLWPVLLAVLFRVCKVRWRLAIAMSAIVVASFAFCQWATLVSQPAAFFLLPARVWEFGLGALIALALLDGRKLFPPLAAAVLGWLGLAGVIGAGMVLTAQTLYPGYAVVIPVLGTALLIATGSAPGSPAALLSVRPLTWIGDISYSLYLVHWPVLVLPVAAVAYMDHLPLWLRTLLALACVPLAWLLYTYVEIPGQRIGWLADARPRRTGAAVAAAMAAVITLTAATATLVHPRLDSGKQASDVLLNAYPPGTRYVPSNLSPALTAADDDRPLLYDNGCQRPMRAVEVTDCVVAPDPAATRVVLFGDSHAAQWFPALQPLADRGAINLETHTKSGCSAAPPPDMWYPECAQWVDNVVAELNAAPPALILLGSYGRRYVSGDDRGPRWQEALTHAVGRLPAESRVAIIADTPSTGVTPAFCLSANLDTARDCALTRSEALDPEIREAEWRVADAHPHVHYLDYTQLFCNATVCPAVIGDELVYRDSSHITTTFSRELADVLMASMERILHPDGDRHGPPRAPATLDTLRRTGG